MKDAREKRRIKWGNESMIESIRKRDGRVVPFELDKIEHAVMKAFEASGSAKGEETAKLISQQVEKELDNNENISGTPSVEEVQDTVERVLIEKGFVRTAKAYILYRAERSRVREMNTRLMKVFEDITYKDAVDSDIKRENANINGDTAMGSHAEIRLRGREAVLYICMCSIPEHAKAHQEGDIHIHDLDFLTLTTTCCQIELRSSVQGRLLHRPRLCCGSPRTSPAIPPWPASPFRPTRTISTAASPSWILITAWPPACAKTFIKRYRDNLSPGADAALRPGGWRRGCPAAAGGNLRRSEGRAFPGCAPTAFDDALKQKLASVCDEKTAQEIVDFAQSYAVKETDPGHLSGHGSPDSQPEHHEFPRGRAGALLLHQLRHRYLPRGAAW